ncbi:MAG: hypothetical protein SH850_28235, partial [Planctomycetaceae bacterium]|nr:hypothetical protein [Planctomycetaceae bacterium]
MQRVKLSLACLLCLSLVGVASAQTALESDSGVASMQEYSGSATFAGTYFDIRTMTGDGVGYRNGYTQIGTLLPIWLDGDRFVAPNTRLIITDLGDVAANSGLVYRSYKADRDRVFGANFYFDYDQSVEGFTYHQVGFGLETLKSDGWDARTNVYLPTTDNDNFVRPLALDCVTPILQGNALGFLATGLYQQSIEGVDFEFGHQLTKSTPWLRGYAGAYFYDAPKDNPIGVRARIDAQISNDFSVGVNVTNDTNFGTNVNAVVDFRFSGWLPTRYLPSYSTRERMLSSVQRNWRIATANTSRDVFAPAKNPDTGNPYFIVWVDSSNNLPGPGTGTFENPLDNVPNSAPGADIIAVKVGDSTLLNPYRASIVLEDNQRLLGDGKAHQITLVPMFEGLMCPVANYTLPGLTTDGNFPYLTSVGNNNVVTLQDNNEVSAFNIVRAGGFAITNFPALGSRDFNLNCLNLTNNTAGGISLTNASGTGMIKTVNALNNTGGGIFIDSAPAGLNLTITDTTSNSVGALPGFPQAFGLRLDANPGPIVANISDSEFNRNTVGVILNGNGGDLTVNTTNVSVDDNITDGVQLTTVGSDVNLFLQNTTINGNGGFGFIGIMTGGSLDMIGRNVIVNNNVNDNLNLDLTDTRMAIDFRNATFNNSAIGSGIVISNSGPDGTGTAVFNNITSTGNFLDGFQLNGDNLANISASVTASILSDNGRDAFSVSGTNGAQVDLTVRTVVATGSGRHGLNFNATSGATLDIDFIASNLDFSGSDAALAGRGVNGFADAATVSLTMVNTTAENSGADGMFVTAVNNAQVGISVQNGNFANSGQNTPGSDGVHIVTDTGADLVMQINNTPINNSLPVPGGTQDDGLVFEAFNNSTVLASVSNSDLSNNLSNAVEATVNSGAVVTLNLLNSNGLNSGEDGIRFDVQTGGQFNLNMQSSNFDLSGQSGTGNGMLGFVRTGGVVTVTALDSSFSNSAENGFELDIANIGSSFTMNMERGNFSDSGRALLGIDRQDAFHITAGDQALVDISLFTTPSANSGGLAGTQQRGLWASVNTGADLIFDDLSGDLSGNLLNAINISVANTGSTALLNITDTPANNSGEDGFIFNVVDSGVLNANFLRSTLDSSGLAGLPGEEFDAIDGRLDTS